MSKKKFNIILFNAKTGDMSEPLDIVDSLKEATRLIEKYRADHLPAFYQELPA